MPPPAAALPARAVGLAGQPLPAAGPAGRPGPLLVLAAAVLAGHAWLVQALAPVRPAPGLPHPAALQVRSVVLPGTALAAVSAQPGAAVAVPHGSGLVPPAAVTVAAVPVSAAPTPPPAALTAPSPDVVVALPLATSAAPGAATGASDIVGPSAGPADGDALPDGEPPPRYATRVPPPARLRYVLQRHGRTADALLTWEPDADGYRLDLQASGPAGRVLLAQTSTGRLDADGLAPDRFVDRRAAGPQRAANFRREIGRIAYSGPLHTHPAWPGAQDRLSWLAQLVAVLAAHPVPPPEIVLFVADATGQAGPWRLQRQPDAAALSSGGPVPLQHWQRAAPRPEALQVDVWFAAPGAGATAWPQRLRFSVPRSGDVLELTLADPP